MIFVHQAMYLGLFCFRNDDSDFEDDSDIDEEYMQEAR